jgi:CDP-diacylglycerol--serine O-phosphatidyltransferase
MWQYPDARMKSLRYLVPTSITALALACGVIAAVYGAQGKPVEGSWFVLYATILDRMDGFAARALNATSQFGVWLDSTSDFVAFGVAPAFLFLGASPRGFEPIVLVPMAIYIGGCGVRLVRFSLQEAQKEFRGVPSTLAGGVYAAGINSGYSNGLVDSNALWLYGAVLVIFGLAMNTPWIRYGKVGGLSTPWLNYFGMAVVATCAIFILVGVLPEFVFGASFTVMLTAPLISRYEAR